MRKFSGMIAANMVYALGQWLVLQGISRLLGPSAVGEFSVAVAWTTPIYGFFNMSLRQVIATSDPDDGMEAVYWSARLMTLLASSLAVGLVLLLVDYSPTIQIAIALMAISRSLDSITDLLYGEHQRNFRFNIISQGMILNGVVSSVAALFLGLLFKETYFFVAGMMFGSLVTLSLTARRSKRVIQPATLWAPRIREGASVLAYAFPLGLTMFLASTTGNFPVIVMEHQLDTASVGRYAAIAYLISAASLAFDAVFHVLLPSFAEQARSGEVSGLTKRASAITTLIFLSIIPGIAIVVIGGDPLLGLVYGEGYQGLTGLLAMMVVYGALNWAASLWGSVLTACQILRPQPLLLAASSALAGVSSIALIPRFGAQGAVIALSFAAALRLAVGIMLYGSYLSQRNAP